MMTCISGDTRKWQELNAAFEQFHLNSEQRHNIIKVEQRHVRMC